MREILFRGKAGSGEWVYGAFIPDLLESLKGYEGLDGYIKPVGKTKEERMMVEVDRETVGQYIGQVDKAQRPIFEGDIVKTKYGRKCIVTWFDPQVCFDLNPICTQDNLALPAPLQSSLWWSEHLEVIGNIFDNPELLVSTLNTSDCPEIDAVPVVRCEECQHCSTDGQELLCQIHFEHIGPKYFCADGERKSDETIPCNNT